MRRRFCRRCGTVFDGHGRSACPGKAGLTAVPPLQCGRRRRQRYYLDDDDTGQDQRAADNATGVETVAHEQEAEQRGENGFGREDDRRVGGLRIALPDHLCGKADGHRNHAGREVVLHSDNGSSMKGSTMLATLEKLGIMPSFSRPRVSNDNAFAEALFRTCKYRPNYPSKPFGSIDEARQWTLSFVQWYNHQHKHSGLKFVTPAQRHDGRDASILSHRKDIYEAAKQRHPERWTGTTRDWELSKDVWLNPERKLPDELRKAA